MKEHLLLGDRYRLAHHYFVYDGNKVDAQAMRDEAEERAFDRHKQQEDSIIHYHPHDDNGNCPPNTEHEYYAAGIGELRE